MAISKAKKQKTQRNYQKLINGLKDMPKSPLNNSKLSKSRGLNMMAKIKLKKKASKRTMPKQCGKK